MNQRGVVDGYTIAALVVGIIVFILGLTRAIFRAASRRNKTQY